MATTVTGRAGSATVNAVALAITGWSAKLNKELADSTDSNNFDPASGQLYASQVPGVISMEATIEGNFDTAGSTSTNIIAKLKSDVPIPLVLKLTQAVTFGSGNFDLSNVDVSVAVPGSTMVTFSATAKSNGIFTLN
jgi:hypothetical protein